MGIDAAGEGEKIFGVEYLFGLICLDIGRDPGDLPVRYPDVAAVYRRLVWAHDPGIFDHEIEMLLHSRPLKEATRLRNRRRHSMRIAPETRALLPRVAAWLKKIGTAKETS
jgi:hypothetical protein